MLVLGIGIFWFRNSILAWFQGTHKVQYEFVIKKFEAESKLVVAGAEVDTTANHTFDNNNLQEWPDWTEPITKLFVGREMSVEIPVQTEFKLVLEGISQSDFQIQNNKLILSNMEKLKSATIAMVCWTRRSMSSLLD